MSVAAEHLSDARAGFADASRDPAGARRDLAALCRLFQHFGWTDLTYTHLSARVPGARDEYLINPYGLLFEEVRASNLVHVGFDGRPIAGEHPYNKAGHYIHTAVLRARPEINFVLHSHTRAAAAVASMRCGLLPLSQPALVIHATVAYHEYGVAEDEDEGVRVAADLGDKHVMLLRNHGLLVCGRTAGEAFLYHYFVQQACEVQLEVMRATDDYVMPSAESLATLAEWGRPRSTPWGGKQWEAMMRLLDRTAPSFRD
jgi:ribulose-5-phosphate 4-epimerase/fuculose-1-phosphate aldolase